MKVLDIINRSLFLLGVGQTGEAADAPQATNALSVLNMMMDQWTLEKFMIYQMSNSLFDTVGNQSAYLIGSMSSVYTVGAAATAGQCTTPTISPITGTFTTQQSVSFTHAVGQTCYYTTDGTTPTYSSTAYTSGTIDLDTFKTSTYRNTAGLYVVTIKVIALDMIAGILTPSNVSTAVLTFPDWVAPRPIKIESAFVRDITPGYANDYKLEIVPNAKYQEIYQKALSTTYPLYLWYLASLPHGICTLWPVPLRAMQCSLSTWLQLTEFATASETIVLPPGYAMALGYGLAYNLAREYGKDPMMFKGQMEEAKGNIKTINTEVLYLNTDAALFPNPGHNFNIYGGNSVGR